MPLEKLKAFSVRDNVPPAEEDTLRTAVPKLNRMLEELYGGLVESVPDVSPSRPAAENTSALLGVMEELEAAGGGVVTIRAFQGGIPLAEQIVPRRNVFVRGQGIQVDGGGTLTGGSFFEGDGTFPCFGYNDTDLGSPLSVNDFAGGWLFGGGAGGLGMTNFSYGVKCGARYNPGIRNAWWGDLYITDWTQWGVWFENFILTDFGIITTVNAPSCVGGQMYSGRTGNSWNPGNSKHVRPFVEALHARARNLVIRGSGAVGGSINHVNMDEPQVNASGAKITRAAVFTNGSTDIGVPDASEFPVNLPLVFEGAGFDVLLNGLREQRTYFVVYSDTASDIIRISLKLGGAAIQATGSNACDAITQGPPAFEIVGEDGGDVQSCKLEGVDSEGHATCSILVSRANVKLQVNISDFLQGDKVQSTVCMRESAGEVTCMVPLVLDIDDESAARTKVSIELANDVGGADPLPYASPWGWVYDRLKGLGGISLGGRQYSDRTLHLATVNALGEAYTCPIRHISQRLQRSATAVQTLYGIHYGAMEYTGATAGTWTLNGIPSSDWAVSGSETGCSYEITNKASANQPLDVVTDGVMLYNGKPGATTITLARYETLVVRGAYDGTTPYWKVLSIVRAADLP